MQNDLSQILAQAFELACDRTLKDLVTDADYKPTENGRVDAERHFLRAGFCKHIPFDGVFLIPAQGERTRYLSRFTLKILPVQQNEPAGFHTREELIQQGAL